MTATAEQLDESGVVQEIGLVAQVEPTLVVTSAASGRIEARRATSCVIAPAPDDTVLVAVAHDGRAWVLAVLERGSETPSRIALEGDAEIEATGELRIRADEGVHVSSKQAVSLVSRLIELRGVEGRAFLDRLDVVGSLARVDVTRVKAVVSYLDQVLERASQTVKRSYRFVEELDVTRAHQIDMRAEKTLHTHAHNTLMTSDALMKVDAEQIHLG